MTIRIEVLWQIDNLRATAEHLLQHRPDVVGRKALCDLEDACGFLIERLGRQLKGEALEDRSFDTINLYKGYWAHLVMVQNARQQGDNLVGELEGMEFSVSGTSSPGDCSDTFSILRPSERTATIAANVTFLVDLTPSIRSPKA